MYLGHTRSYIFHHIDPKIYAYVKALLRVLYVK